MSKIPTVKTLTNNTDSHSWDFEVIKTEEDAKIFVETMENIPKPNDKLKKAFEDFKKQETIEEFIRKESKSVNESVGIIKGAKWQQERMYSEEDVHNILNNYKSFISSGMKIPYFEWFEQFKKK